MSTTDDGRAHLPAQLRRVADEVGMDAVHALLNASAGQEVYVPLHPTPRLLEVCGQHEALARWVCEARLPPKWRVPTAAAWRRWRQRQQIAEMRRAGMTRGQIARSLMISTESVRRQLAR